MRGRGAATGRDTDWVALLELGGEAGGHASGGVKTNRPGQNVLPLSMNFVNLAVQVLAQSELHF